MAAILDRMTTRRVIMLGVPVSGAERFATTTKDRERPGAVTADGLPIIARTKANFDFPEGPAWMGLDFDTEGMPAAIAEKIPGNRDILDDGPDLDVLGYDGVARVERASASAGLRGPDGVARRSDNKHVYLLVADGRDIPRVVEALYVRTALEHGALYAKTSKAGTVLLRGLFDLQASASPERLWFEGETLCTPDVTREPGARDAKAYPGRVWNTREEIPDLTPEERQQFTKLCHQVRAAAQPEADRVRDEYHAREKTKLVRAGVPEAQARAAVAARGRGLLLGPDLITPDDGPPLPLADILNDPGKYPVVTCLDPIEPDTRNRAIIRTDHPANLFTQKHGGGTYYLRHTTETALEAIAKGVDLGLVLRFWRPADPVERDKFAAALAKAQGVTKAAARAAVKQALRDLPPLPEPRQPVGLGDLPPVGSGGDPAADFDGVGDREIAELNGRFFMTTIGGATAVAREEKDGRLTYMRPQAFRNYFANRHEGDRSGRGWGRIGCGTRRGGRSSASRCCPGPRAPARGLQPVARAGASNPRRDRGRPSTITSARSSAPAVTISTAT